MFICVLSHDNNAQVKCSDISGKWYYTLTRGAKEPISVTFKNCGWHDNENPMGNRKGKIAYVTKAKKLQIFGFTESDGGPAYITVRKNYAFVAYKSSWTNRTEYIVLSRVKQKGKWYDEITEQLHE